MSDEIKDVIVVNETEVVKVEEQKAMLFGKGSANDQINEALEVANAVTAIAEKKNLIVTISNKKFAMCEAWTTMGALLGVFPHLVGEVRELAPGRFSATVELKTMSGHSIGRAEAECSTSEGSKFAKLHAAKSMAQTRATGKAFRLSFSWLMVLAGYSPTPAEEMFDAQEKEETPNDSLQRAYKLAKQHENATWAITEFYGVEKFSMIPKTVVEEILEHGVVSVLERIKKSKSTKETTEPVKKLVLQDGAFNYHMFFRNNSKTEVEIQKLAGNTITDVYLVNTVTDTCNCKAGSHGKYCKHKEMAVKYCDIYKTK